MPADLINIPQTIDDANVVNAPVLLVSALDNEEFQALQQAEQTIEQGLSTFVAVGVALETIKVRRLYRATHNTFAAYCADRFHISESRARQLRTAARITTELVDKQVDRTDTIVTLLSTIPSTSLAPITPSSESVARPLASLPSPDDRALAWADAVAAAGGEPTASQVALAVIRRHERNTEERRARQAIRRMRVDDGDAVGLEVDPWRDNDDGLESQGDNAAGQLTESQGDALLPCYHVTELLDALQALQLNVYAPDGRGDAPVYVYCSRCDREVLTSLIQV